MTAALRDVPQDAIELIKSFEGIPDGDPSSVNLDAYLDPLDIWTIGWGHAVVHEGRHLKGRANRAVARALYPGGITRAQAETLLRADLLDRAPSLLKLVKVPLTDAQFGALMSFAFNCGLGNLGASTLLRLLNARNFGGAADQFLVWNKGRQNGTLVELPGLTRRRRAERALFLSEDWRVAGVPSAARGAPGAPGMRGAPTATRPLGRVPAAERPVRPSAAAQRRAAQASGGAGVAALVRAQAARKVAKGAPKVARKAAPKTRTQARTQAATPPRPRVAAPAKRRAAR